jgi:hypothetical protein
MSGNNEREDMERITQKTLDLRVGNVNRRLEGTGLSVNAQSRNGWTGLDEYRDGKVQRMITAGTKREVADFLHAMMVGIDMSRVTPQD